MAKRRPSIRVVISSSHQNPGSTSSWPPTHSTAFVVGHWMHFVAPDRLKVKSGQGEHFSRNWNLYMHSHEHHQPCMCEREWTLHDRGCCIARAHRHGQAHPYTHACPGPFPYPYPCPYPPKSDGVALYVRSGATRLTKVSTGRWNTTRWAEGALRLPFFHSNKADRAYGAHAAASVVGKLSRLTQVALSLPTRLLELPRRARVAICGLGLVLKPATHSFTHTHTHVRTNTHTSLLHTRVWLGVVVLGTQLVEQRVLEQRQVK